MSGPRQSGIYVLGAVTLIAGLVGYRSSVRLLPAFRFPGTCASMLAPSLAAWVGRWYIATADGRLQGETVISPAPVGCGVWEQWHGTSGGNGRSLSLADPSTGRWSHMFVNDTGLVLTADGVDSAGKLIWTLAHFSEPRDTGEHEQWEWSSDTLPRHSGRVSHDGGKTWQRIFSFSYHPWSDSLPPVSRHNGPCHTMSGYRSLDYYVGTWEVLGSDGRPAGESRVDTLLDGCALREDTRGAHDSSFRFFSFDPLAHRWRALGASADRGLVKLEGTTVSPSSTSFMEVGSVAAADHVRTRWVLDQLSRDRLRWREEHSSDAGRTWAATSERLYRRRPT